MRTSHILGYSSCASQNNSENSVYRNFLFIHDWFWGHFWPQLSTIVNTLFTTFLLHTTTIRRVVVFFLTPLHSIEGVWKWFFLITFGKVIVFFSQSDCYRINGNFHWNIDPHFSIIVPFLGKRPAIIILILTNNRTPRQVTLTSAENFPQRSKFIQGSKK